jgi:hypothetical protein
MRPMHFASVDWREVACGCNSVRATRKIGEVTCLRCLRAVAEGWPETGRNR